MFQFSPQRILCSRITTLLARWTIVLSLWTLLISMAIGRFGISNFMELEQDAAVLRERIQDLSLENQLMQQELDSLRTSSDFRKLYLANEFGLFEPGVKLLLTDKIPKHPQPAPRRSDYTVSQLARGDTETRL